MSAWKVYNVIMKYDNKVHSFSCCCSLRIGLVIIRNSFGTQAPLLLTSVPAKKC